MLTDRESEGKEYDGPWVTECSGKELVDLFEDWEPEVQVLLKVSHNCSGQSDP